MNNRVKALEIALAALIKKYDRLSSSVYDEGDWSKSNTVMCKWADKMLKHHSKVEDFDPDYDMDVLNDNLDVE